MNMARSLACLLFSTLVFSSAVPVKARKLDSLDHVKVTTVSLFAKSPQATLDLSFLVSDGHYTDIDPRHVSTVTTHAPNGSSKKYIITKIATGGKLGFPTLTNTRVSTFPFVDTHGLGFSDTAGTRFVLSASWGQARLSVLLPASGAQNLYFFDAEIPTTTTTSHTTIPSNVNTTSLTHDAPSHTSTLTSNTTTTTSTPTQTKTVEKVETVTTTKDSKSIEMVSVNSTDSISTTDTTSTVDTTSVIDTPTAVEIIDSKTTATTQTTVDDKLTDTRDSLDTLSTTHNSDNIKTTETISSTSKHAGASPSNTTKTSYSTVNTNSTTDKNTLTNSLEKTESTSTKHTSLTTRTTHTSVYMGCYADFVVVRAHAGAHGNDSWTGSQWLMRDLPNAEVDPSNSVEACMQHAIGAGSPFFGLEEAQECWYGNVNTLLKDVTRRNKVPEGRCNLACVGNKMQMCGGGSGAISLYSIATATQVA